MAKTSASGKSGGVSFDLQKSPSHLIHRVQQFAADRFAEETKGSSITQRQFAVLVSVAQNEGLSQTALVQATGIDRSTLAELVARMTTRGLLSRARDKEDARAKTVSLTAAGRRALQSALPKVQKADDKILDILPKTKRDDFNATMGRVAESMTEEKPAAKKAPAKSAAAKKPAAKKPAAKKPAAKKATAKKTAAKKPAAKAASTRTATKAKAAKKPAPKARAARKPAAKATKKKK